MKIIILNTPILADAPGSVQNNTRESIAENIHEIVQSLPLASKEIQVEFSHNGVSSLVAILTNEEERKFVLKFPVRKHEGFHEVHFLKAWKKGGAKTPEIISHGTVNGFKYILMEFVNTPTYYEKYLEYIKTNKESTFDISFYEQVGEQLAQTHTEHTAGYGRFIDEKAEYNTHGEWLTGNPYIDRMFSYFKEHNLHKNLSLPIFDKAVVTKEILRHIPHDQTKSYWCHMDCSLGNIFATKGGPILFDPSGIVSHPYYDIAQSMILTCIYHTDPIEPSMLLLEGYIAKTKTLDIDTLREILIPFLKFEAVMKIRRWHAHKITERLDRLGKLLNFYCKSR